jgi:hypothetical protein
MATQCSATAKSTGQRCERPVVPGAKVCRFHGGQARQVKAAGALRLAEEEARKGLARLDVSPVEDPFTALSELAGQVVAWKDQLAAKVNDLTTIRYEAMGAGTEQLRAEVALFERALDRCASVLGLIAKLNIDERMARISEKQAEALLRALSAGLAHAGVTGHRAAEARAVAARELRSAA